MGGRLALRQGLPRRPGLSPTIAWHGCACAQHCSLSAAPIQPGQAVPGLPQALACALR